MNKPILSILFFCFALTANAQDDYLSTLYIPITVENSAVKEIIANSTDDVLVLSDSLEMSKYEFALDILDKETKLWHNSISHTIEFTGGSGYQSSRTGVENPLAFGGKLYTPWITLSCDDIKGESTADINVNITPDYQIITESSFKAEIKNAKCNGVRMNRVMRMLGYDTMSDTMSYKMNENLAAMDLRGNIEKIWFDLQKPIQVDENTYILVEPMKLVYKDFYFEERQLKFAIGIQMRMGVSNTEDAKKWNIFKPLPKLEKLEQDPEEKIHFNTPVKIDYKTIENQLKENLIGEYVTKEDKRGCEKKIAKILDITVDHSNRKDFDVVVGAKVKFLKYFKKKEGFIYFHADLDYDKSIGRIAIPNYKVDSQVNSWLANTAIESGANVFFKKKINKSMMANINEQIKMIQTTLNDYIKDEVHIQEGLTFKGNLDHFEVTELSPQENHLFMTFDFKGALELHIYKM